MTVSLLRLRKRLRPLLLGALAATSSSAALAHNLWLLPSDTVLSGQAPWITVDAAVSNDIFYFNHVPLRLNGLQVTGPDGASVDVQHAHTGKLRSTFDLELTQPGTYRLAVINRGVVASYQLDGEQKRWRGTADALAEAIPARATDVRISEVNGRVETFVTSGSPTDGVLEPTGSGLELQPATHPNDLYAGERADFRLLADGAAAAGVEVLVVPGGTRYRNQQDGITTTTDEQGRFSIVWPNAGRYFLDASLESDRVALAEAEVRRLGYTATFEVLPQ